MDNLLFFWIPTGFPLEFTPAKAGVGMTIARRVKEFKELRSFWIPAFAGMTKGVGMTIAICPDP